VSGRVVDEEGKSIPIVTIRLSGETTGTVVSDAQGNFSRSGLQGEVTLTATKSGYSMTAPVLVTGPRNDITFIASKDAPADYTVSGRVVDNEGRGIPVVTITLSGETTGTVVSDAQGNFSRSGLQGEVTLTATKEGYTITGPFTVTGAEDNMVFIATNDPPADYTASGKVVDEDGKGIPSVTITFRGDTEATTITDSEGNFSRSGLSGTVFIHASKAGYTLTGPITVKGADDDITFIARLKSTYYEVGGKAASIGRLPIEGVMISFEDDKGRIGTAFTDADGNFWKPGLIGQATVSAFLEGWLFTPETRVVNGTDYNLNFHGTPDPESAYQIAGSVVDFNGVAVSGVSIRFDFLDLERGPMYTVTRSDGSWTMDGLIGRVQITPMKNGLTFEPASQVAHMALMSMAFRVQ
jgi:hypothetical protein